ncbi:tyrosine-protein phosphatase [Arthrobacter zhaoguopingii]|uniref:tyrosine-protein phosphatase n=1 Tax=Arthrobacter zhaoguopingii TaxID=2681491 RepID=UPI0013586B2E|nr:tyrosine-protein phosphatase [Arthrobacter zhaoguopingii]
MTPPGAVQRRDVGWEGAVNARDLGGVAGRVLPGRIYRMGRREWLTDRGWQQAWDDGVRTVVDLRNPGEVGRRASDPVLGGTTAGRFLVRNLPTEDPSDAGFRALCGPYLNNPLHYRDNLERWPGKFAAVARAVVAAPAGGVIVHCAAGRDRTGMVTSLLLAACGVPAGDIADDYEVAVRTMNERYRTQAAPRESPRSAEELSAWLHQARTHLLELLSTLDAGAYLREAGLSPGELTALRTRLTL